MSIAHTPGPWTRESGQRFRENCTPEAAGVRGPNGNYVAAAFDFNRYDRDAEVEANARLIAAAPELLAALETIIALTGEGTARDDCAVRYEAHAIAEAAVAKVEGGAS